MLLETDRLLTVFVCVFFLFRVVVGYSGRGTRFWNRDSIQSQSFPSTHRLRRESRIVSLIRPFILIQTRSLFSLPFALVTVNSKTKVGTECIE